MGEKGARLTGTATEVAEALVDDLAGLGDVTSKKMFGGVGLFEDGVMFLIVDSTGGVFLRADDDTAAKFAELGSSKHARMPYYSVPGRVLADPAELLKWATEALDVAKAAKN